MKYASRFALLSLLVSPFGLADTVLEKLSLCAKNADSLQRLVCYDNLTDSLINPQLKSQTIKPQAAQQPTHTSDKIAASNKLAITADVEPKPLTPKPIAATSTPMLSTKAKMGSADSAKQSQTTFGLEDKQSSEQKIQQISATVIKVQKAPRGERVVSLDNGQVWRQTDSTRFRIKQDQMVFIKRGILGSFFMGKENANKSIRVKRVK